MDVTGLELNWMLDYFRQMLLETTQWTHTPWVIELVLILGVAIGAVATYFIAEGILYLFKWLIALINKAWIKTVFNPKICKALSQLAPALTVNYMLPTFFVTDTAAHRWISTLTSIYILVAVVYCAWVLLDNIQQALRNDQRSHRFAVPGVFDMIQLIAVLIGIIVGISIIFHKQPSAILTAIGASAAVLMLVFKDTIMGLVASIQFSVHEMLHENDWIVCETHGINGRVKDVSLTNIKVKNWDNSISNIPPYTLASASFRNYKNMLVEEARRIDRSILLDATTIRFLSPDELADLQEAGFLDGLDIPEAERLVNSTLFRRYLRRYLMHHPNVVHRHTQTILTMVRQLEMTPTGLPLQLYFFTWATDWVEFEQVQSDIFDHVYAVVNHFGLRIYQSPTGRINP